MKRYQSFAALVLILALALTLAGCGAPAAPAAAESGPAVSDAPGSDAPADAPGGGASNLRVSMVGSAAIMDPTAASSPTELSVLSHLFEGLMRWDSSDQTAAPGLAKARLVPGIAESYDKTVTEDGMVVYTFHLRQAKWSDGKPVTAHDFAYSWQRLVDPANSVDYAYMLDCVEGAAAITAGLAQLSDLGVRAVDDTTLEVRLYEDAPWFLEFCALAPTAPLRQDAIEEGGTQWIYSAKTFLTNGPYKVRDWDRGGQMVLEKNDQYYAPVEGPDTLDFYFQADDQSAGSAFSAGNLDFVWAAQDAPDALHPARLSSYYLVFQTRKAPFNDARVRQAFTLAVDREKLVREQAPGQTPAAGLVPTGTTCGTGQDFRFLAGSYFDPTEKGYAANCQKARLLLAQAGYPEGAGFPEVTYLCPDSATQTAIGEALAEMWKEVLGVTVTVEAKEWGSFLGSSHKGEFSIARGRWTADYNDPTDFLELFHSDSEGDDAQYAEPAFDDFLAKSKAADDPARRAELLVQAEGLLVGRDWVVGPLYFETETCAIAKGVTGVYYAPQGYFFFDRGKKS